MTRYEYGFQSTVKIPWGERVAYKFIVDGRWTTTDTQPTELDPIGNINNVYNSPARPVQPKLSAPVIPVAVPEVVPPVSEPPIINPTEGETVIAEPENTPDTTAEVSEPVKVTSPEIPETSVDTHPVPEVPPKVSSMLYI